MTNDKTPLKFPNQVEQKIFDPVAPPQYEWDKSVIDILLSLESVESANPQKEYVVYNRGCAVQLMHIVSKIEGCAV